VTTTESSTCRYGTVAGTEYASLPTVFATTGGTTHTSPLTGLTNGASYLHYVRCQDVAGNATTSDTVISFNVAAPDTTPPTVSITAPANASTVTGVVTITADAGDDLGVIGVQFLLDGAPLGAEDMAAPYSLSWNTTAAANGVHQLAARARDAAGNLTTSSPPVTVTVNNTAPTGLVAAYNFNEGTGTTLTDRTGNGRTGTISGAAWSPSGKFGGALSFDGVNDWVTVSDANSLDLTTGMTLEAWVFPTASGGGSWRNVIIKQRPNGEVYNLYSNADTNVPVVYAARSGSLTDARGTAALPLNTWKHLATTYDGATLRLYVDGVQVGSRPMTGAMVTSTGVLRIGGNSVWGEFFQGRIDEIRIYNRALTAEQIQADAATPVP
jgi:hypothetical protein